MWRYYRLRLRCYWNNHPVTDSLGRWMSCECGKVVKIY